MAIDNKYGRVTLEHGTIGDDEPVVVFRAQDVLLPDVLKVYRVLCKIAGSPLHHLDAIHAAAEQVRAWQANHHHRVPNSDAYLARISTDPHPAELVCPDCGTRVLWQSGVPDVCPECGVTMATRTRPTTDTIPGRLYGIPANPGGTDGV